MSYLSSLMDVRDELEKPLRWWVVVAMLAATRGDSRWRPFGADCGSRYWAILRKHGFIEDAQRDGVHGFNICIPQNWVEFFRS